MITATRDDVLKDGIKVEIEILKIAVAVSVVLTGGIISLTFQGMNTPLKIFLFMIGFCIDTFFIIFALRAYMNIKRLLNKMEEKI